MKKKIVISEKVTAVMLAVHNNQKVDLLNNIKVFWLCINRNVSEDVNFIKKFKLF